MDDITINAHHEPPMKLLTPYGLLGGHHVTALNQSQRDNLPAVQ